MRMQDLLSSNHISTKIHKEEAPSAEETKPLTLAGSSSLGPEDMGGDPSVEAESSSISPSGGLISHAEASSCNSFAQAWPTRLSQLHPCPPWVA